MSIMVYASTVDYIDRLRAEINQLKQELKQAKTDRRKKQLKELIDCFTNDIKDLLRKQNDRKEKRLIWR